jgi:hypothetical protein
MSNLTSIKDPEEGRNVDFLMYIGMAASAEFWRNANVDDVLGALESCDNEWPLQKLIELRDAIHEMILNSAAQGPHLVGLTNQT